MAKTVKVKWIPPEETTTMIETQAIRIQMDEDHPDKVWISMLENGEVVEDGRFDMSDFMDAILEFYNRNY